MRKKIAFITLYDTICYGTRLLSRIVSESQCEPHLIFLKKERYFPLLKKKDEYKTYQFYYNGLLRGSCYAIDHISDTEIKILLDTLEKICPSIICLSTRSFALSICRNLFPLIKKRLPSVPIVAGGWGPTLEVEKFLEFCDYVCFGEGESTMRSICKSLNQNRSFKDIPNLVYRTDNRLVRNKVEHAISIDELNELPLPDFSVEHKYLISDNKIEFGEKFYNEKIYDLFAARGCPLYCSYCLSSKYNIIYKKYSGIACPKYRLRDIDTVFAEAMRAKERGAKYLRIKDEVFPIVKVWVQEFIERYPREIGLPFFAHVRPEFHDPETLRKLKEAGLRVTILGIQSGSQEIRTKIYNRKLPKNQVVQFAKTLHKLDIQFIYHFIYRNPFEREHHLKESLEFTYELPYAKPFFFKLEPLPGTPLKKMIDSKNPTPIPVSISDWYALLHSMSLNGPFLRRMARFIHTHKLFRRFPLALIIFFVPSLGKELYITIQNRLILKASFNYFRIT